VADDRRRGLGGRSALALLGMSIAVVACADGASPATGGGDAPAGPTGRPITAFFFQCDDGSSVVAKLEDDGRAAWLFLPRQTVRLSHVPAASGAKYSDGQVTFWTKGREALVEAGAAGSRRCIENRRRSVIEDAKLRGADFWATGNEPGWTLEIDWHSILFVTNYGQGSFRFPRSDSEVDQARATTSYTARDAGHRITVRLSGAACKDSMSGESFETTVQITLEGRVYQGCGQALH
jgi:membrane-bound inhibitor of C-type lysozyme